MSWLPYIAAASLYPLVSVCLMRARPFKRFVHPPRPQLSSIRCSAHRGGAGEAPENTIAAFQHSQNVGVNLFELDVHLTKDKQVVVYHDKTVDRLDTFGGGKTGHVKDFDYADLPSLPSKLPLPPPFHEPEAALDWLHAPDAALDDGHRPPLLSALFERFPDTAMNIDCKAAHSQELVEATAKLIEQHQREALTIWGSADDEQAQRMYTRNPSIPLFASGRQMASIYLRFLSGVLPFSHIKESAIEVPLFTPALKERMKKHLGGPLSGDQSGVKGWLTRAVFRSYGWVSTNQLLLQHLQARNIRVIFWVLNSDEEFEAAFDLGADSVMTDFPAKLATWLEKRDAAGLAAGRRNSNANGNKQE